MGNEVCGKNVLCNIILDSQQNMVRDRITILQNAVSMHFLVC